VQRAVRDSLCDLEMMLCPHTVLFIRVAERVPLASERQARGRGSTRDLFVTIAASSGARAGCPIKRKGSGIDRAYAHLSVPGRSHTGLQARSMQAHPLGAQLDARLTRSAPSSYGGTFP
jgi:hypothetical protein